MFDISKTFPVRISHEQLSGTDYWNKGFSADQGSQVNTSYRRIVAGHRTLPLDDHRSGRPRPRPHLRQRHDRLRRRAVGAPLDHHRHEPRGADAGEAPAADREVRLLPAARAERRRRGAQPGRHLDRGAGRRGPDDRPAADLRLPDGAARHPEKHRPQHVPRSDLRPARTDPRRGARGAQPRGRHGLRGNEAQAGGEAGRPAPRGGRQRGHRRRRAPLAAARHAARRDCAGPGPPAAQGGHGPAGREVPGTDPPAGVARVGGAVRRRPGLAGVPAGSAGRLPRRVAGEDGRG